ncbi:type II toxin-antitoxin system RelE/ParE family toxin [Pannonibacter sp.]|uniref:type II toxin-antitoxin system RelE/ParE family toxin n=1 Tax=Pannonibacter sp. TaxID=1906786 RepID=UPI003F70B3E2
MNLEFSPAAAGDLEQIADQIALDNPARALQFVDQVEALCRSLTDFPFRAAERSDISPGLRLKPFGLYLVAYRVLPNRLRIERILHGARDLPALFADSGGNRDL